MPWKPYFRQVKIHNSLHSYLKWQHCLLYASSGAPRPAPRLRIPDASSYQTSYLYLSTSQNLYLGKVSDNVINVSRVCVTDAYTCLGFIRLSESSYCWRCGNAQVRLQSLTKCRGDLIKPKVLQYNTIWRFIWQSGALAINITHGNIKTRHGKAMKKGEKEKNKDVFLHS